MSGPTMTRLRDLGEWSGGNTPSKANPAYWTDGTVPWVSPKDMKVDEIAASEDCVTDRALADGRVSLVPRGAVLLVTRSGILAHTLPVAVTKVPVTINQDLKALSPKAGVMPKYVAHALRGASQRILKACSKHGTTVASVETNALLDFEIPMVGVDDQRAIVAEIEKQFSRLDEAVANLQRVKFKLKVHRLAILQSAMSGELKGARIGSSVVETSVTELKAIAQQKPVERTRRGVPEDVSPSLAADRVHVPKGWSKCSVAELLRYGALRDVKDGNHGTNHPKTSEFTYSGLPFITASEVDDFMVDYDSAHKIEGRPLAKLKVGFAEPNDVILTHKGTVGRVAICRQRCVLSPQTTYYRLEPEAFIPAYLQYYFASPQFGNQLAEVKSQTTRDYVPISEQYRLFVLRPPLAEQRRIATEVDRRLSIVREVEVEVDANLKRAEALRQAVLQRAFSGQLACQPLPTELRPKLQLVPGTTTATESARVALSTEIVHRLHAYPTFGQVKHQKIFHLCEHIARLDALKVQYRRAGYGPLNLPMIEANERVMEQLGWYAQRPRPGSAGHQYVHLSKAGEHAPYLACFSDEQLKTIRRMIDLMRDWKTNQCEMFSTVYAAWNDLLIMGREATPDAIVREVLELWDEKKQRFSRQQWLDQVTWITKHGFVPTGFGQLTRSATDGVTLDLFRDPEH